MYCMTSRVMKKILNPHSTYSSRNPQMILPIKPQELQNPKQKNPNPYLNKATQDKKKVSLTVHVRFLSINLQYLIFTFGGFTRMRKSVKSAACVFFTPVTMRWKLLFYTHFFCKDFANKLCITSSALCHVHSAKNIDKFCTLLR